VPLIQIDLDRELFDSLGDKLSDAVHQAQIDALDIPADDMFQVFTPHDPGELRFDPGYNGVDRQRLLLLRITMVHMYPVATKQRLFRTIVERFADAGVRAEDILISVSENGYEDWYAGQL
jgi:Tautomerase enzyme